MKLRNLFIPLVIMVMAACQEAEYPVEVPVYADVDNLVTVDKSTTTIGGEYTVKSMDSFTYGIKGMQSTDEVKLRYQQTGELMSWSWGYQYLGILTGHETAEDSAKLLISNGRKYEPDTITVGYNVTDQWKMGKWDLIVCRGSESQVIGTFDCKVLMNDSVDFSRVNGGIIGVYADGWQVGEDTFLIVRPDTKEPLLSVQASATSESSSTKVVNLSFVPDSIAATGTYLLQIKRWGYAMVQDLGTVDFFYYQYATPVFTKDGDDWYINVMLDEVVDGDRFVVGYNNNKKSFTHNISEENFDAETNVYRILIEEKALNDEETYAVMLRKSTYNMNLGEVTLNMSEFE